MEDKTFELLEKMYIEMQGMKQNIKGIEGNIRVIEENMTTKQDIVRLENKMDANDKALYDGYKQSIEGISEINKKLDKLTDRVENQEIKLQVLKSVK